MRIKIIGENSCARATRHLLRLAGFAVTEFLPAEAIAGGPGAGYAITIDVAPGNCATGADAADAVIADANAVAVAAANRADEVDIASPSLPATFELAPANHTPDSCLRPDPATQHLPTSACEEANRMNRNASSPAFADASAGIAAEASAGMTAVSLANLGSVRAIHFDSVDSALEAAVLRHVTQLSTAPVILDRPGGVVHSDRQLRIVAPNSGNLAADEAAAVAIEFGVLRGLLDLAGVAASGTGAGQLRIAGSDSEAGQKKVRRWSWWPFLVLVMAGGLAILWGIEAGAALVDLRRSFFGDRQKPVPRVNFDEGFSGPELKPVSFFFRNASAAPLLRSPGVAATLAAFREGDRLKPALLAAQGQFETGGGVKITDGNDFLVVDPCKGQVKSFVSINQTGNTQLVSGTVSKKIYVCSVHVVVAAATNLAVVEGTGSVCATGTAGVGGFGGGTAATGWNFAANGGIALGNGDSSLGAEATGGDNLCLFNSGSGQVSGGISYVVQ